MAFKANVLLIYSLVLLIISSEVIAREMVEPSLPMLESNEVQNIIKMNDATLHGQKKDGGRKGKVSFNLMCLACECPKKNDDDDDDDDNNNNNNNSGGFVDDVCKAMCC
ncbi:uncharacterized protein LOC132067830 [Lycium ferocissimum]|uniref:uncharacterized protein LOC132067830 n=1 Tax=Lycium ferocissimum TaxID=112874 RepID=UPI0028150EAB|nr:uncharacterized protein LOC132067830 [Lycium ferocissimum]